ncbi:MAG: hypothetical protein FJX67_06540, partial [Alphaproteobacteria bacterium]|nr:hypothetical protein [Alphaproteobacteria bacterium]
MARIGPLDNDRQLMPYDPDRRPVGRARRRLLTALVALVALGGFGGVAYHFYEKNRDAAMEGIVPILKAVEGPTKVRPETPGGMQVPNRDREVYGLIDKNAPAPKPRVEQLLPPPEQPVERPIERAPEPPPVENVAEAKPPAGPVAAAP